jgi:hypothetical protein
MALALKAFFFKGEFNLPTSTPAGVRFVAIFELI